MTTPAPAIQYANPLTRKTERWRYYAQRAISGAWLDRVGIPITAPTFTWDLASNAFNGIIQPRYQKLIREDGMPLFEEWATLLYAVDSSDQIRWGGIVSSATYQGSVWTLTGVGYRGWANGQIFLGSEYSHTDIDPMDVVRYLWDYLQDQNDANLNMTVDNTKSPMLIGDTTTQSTVTDKSGKSHTVNTEVPYKLAWWNGTDIGQELQNLATATPFDMDEIHSWNSDKSDVNHRLVLGYPRLGTRQSDLRFVEGENITDLVQVTKGDGSTPYANVGVGYGAGTGSKMQHYEMAQPDGVHLRRMLTVTDQSITNWRKLNPIVKRNLVAAQGNMQGVVASCTFIDHGNAPVGSFSAGDDILIQVRSGWLAGLSIWHRIVSYTFTPDNLTGTLTLARSDSFTYTSDLSQVQTG